MLLHISTSFWMLCAPESWSKQFFQPFSTLFVQFEPFSVNEKLLTNNNIKSFISDFTPEIKKKHLKMHLTRGKLCLATSYDSLSQERLIMKGDR